MKIIHKITDHIKHICPIHGISAVKADPHKWRIDFKDESTSAQRQAAKDWLATCDLDAIQAELDAEQAEKAKELDMVPVERKVLIAILEWISDCELSRKMVQPPPKLMAFIEKYREHNQ